MIDRRRGLLAVKKLNLPFNQLVHNGNFVSIDNWSTINSTFNVENNIGTIKKRSSSSPYGGMISTQIEGLNSAHKYYMIVELKSYSPSVGSYFHFGATSGTVSGNTALTTYSAEDFEKLKQIVSPKSSSNKLLIRAGSSDTSVNDTVCYAKNAMCIDLTAMYGAGNEPTTTEQVEKDCAAIGRPLTQYQEYTGL